MIKDFIILNGYGYFIWPAFIFTFFCCAALYFKTMKKYRKYENLFHSEFTKVNVVESKAVKEKEFVKKTLSSNPIF